MSEWPSVVRPWGNESGRSAGTTGYFLVQTYHTVFGNEPAQTGINYWFYDTDARKFRIIFFSNNGPFTEDGNRYEGEAKGRTLTLGRARPLPV